MIEAQNVGVEINGRALLSNISFEVRKGEFRAIAGPNGAGKSTLLKLLSGDMKPTSGKVLFREKQIQGFKSRELARLRSVLAQHNPVSLPFQVRDIVLMGRYPFHENAPAKEDDLIVESCMKKVEIQHLAKRLYPSLSGGERQRVQLARTLAQLWTVDNGLMLLDEPTTGLDVKHQLQILEIAKEMTRNGYAVVAVLHDLNFVLQYADRVLLLKKGRLYADDKPDQVLTESALKEVFEVGMRLVTGSDPNESWIVPEPRLGLEEFSKK